jgi:hypothetical protein
MTPTSPGVIQAAAAILDILNTEALVFPLDAKAKRLAERLALAAIASLPLPAPGEGGPGLTSPEAIKNLIGMVRAEAASWREPESYEPRDAVDEAAFLDVIADTLEALSPTAPELPVKVKLLEWRKKSARNYYATTILGTYGAADALGTAAAGLTHILPPAWIDPAGAHHEVDSVETAKVAAQADFEARILSALVRRATHIDQPQTDDMQPDTYTGGDFNGVVRGKRP